MIRILHILPSLNVGAGMPSLVMNYYKHIDRKKVQFDFMYFIDSPVEYTDEILSLGGNVYKSFRPNLSCKFRRYINDFLKNHKDEFTAIHCHPIFSAGIFGFYAKKYGINHVIAHSHSSKYSEKRISALRNWLMMNLVHLYTTEYFACSKNAARLFGNRRQNEVFILKNAIDISSFKYSPINRNRIRTELGISPSGIVIGHVGRFTVEKNQVFIIKLFKKCLEYNCDLTLVLVGDGELFEKIKKYTEELGISEKVIFTGKRKDVDCLVSAFDIFVFPSLFEGFGLSLLEAEASGAYCLASDKLPDEVFISDNVDKLSLKYMNEWINRITGFEPKDSSAREDYSNIVLNKGYDIIHETKKLEKYYMELK